MGKEELYKWVEDTNTLNGESLSVLSELIKEYPYFSTARNLYLKNLALTNSLRLGIELKKMSVAIPDRKKLFLEIQNLSLVEKDKKENIVEDPFFLIDSFLSDQEENAPAKETSFSIHPSVSSDYIYWAYSGELVKEDEKKLKHHELIDSFISEDEKNGPLRLRNKEAGESKKEVVSENIEHEVKPLDDSYFTETLARIYVKQKRYEKALQIIRKLSLKYPEKNVYFADQIRFLEKLIINTKK